MWCSHHRMLVQRRRHDEPSTRNPALMRGTCNIVRLLGKSSQVHYMSTNTAAVVTRVVSFLGSDGESHEIDCGLVTAGKDKGSPKKRLSGAAVLAYLQTCASNGMSAEDLKSAVLGTKSLGISDDGPRDESFDALFESFVESKRKSRVTATYSRTDLTKAAVLSVCAAKDWNTIAAFSEKAPSVEEAFGEYLYAVSPDGEAFAKAVVRQRGQQQVVLNPS